MTCPVNKIDSNVTGLAYAEEECLKQLPTTPTWFEMEPNSYSDFGGEITTMAREPIDPGRQRQKGTITDLEASGGLNTDITNGNLNRLMQGFLFADAREKGATIPLNGVSYPVTGITEVPQTYEMHSDASARFKLNDLVLGSGFTSAANNAFSHVTALPSEGVTVTNWSGGITVETPPSDAKLETVGFQFPSGDLNVSASPVTVVLETITTDCTSLNLNVGEWIFVGGNVADSQFANNAQGYARIEAISTNAIQLSETTWTPVSETGTGFAIQIFFATFIRNENDPALIKRRSYQLERTLGSDADGVQSEYITGAVSNEFTLNIPSADKLNADLSFIALDSESRTGAVGIKSGTRDSSLVGKPAFNTSSDIYRLRLANVVEGEVNSSELVAYVTEGNISIANNVAPTKAIGTLGGFDATAGNFEVGGSITAYFATVAAIAAIRNNADVQLNLIAAQDNAGIVYDIPRMTLGGGRLNVEKDSPITIPLENTAIESALGYTLGITMFAYLPDVAMV